MKILKITDPAFAKYGKIVSNINIYPLIDAMKSAPRPDDVVYIPSVETLEATYSYTMLKDQFFGGMPIQIGYCNGKNHKLNALEYHRSSELNIACSDCILLLGRQQDVDLSDFSYDTANVEAFKLPKGVMVEIYATTLHYAPISIGDNYFSTVVVLPRGTNTALNFIPVNSGEPRLLTATNKWLIAHPEAGIDGAHIGLKGVNHTI